MKNIVKCLDVGLSKNAVIRLCKENNISYSVETNINGGNYINCIVGYDYNRHETLFADIYYKSWMNSLLYKANLLKSKKYYIKQILDMFNEYKEAGTD